MHKIDSRRVQGAAGAARVLALLLVICLAECATGSCLSYGHSCWGAHGKRSGKSPSAAPDWYLTRLLRRIAASAEMNRARQDTSNDDLNAIFQIGAPDEALAYNLMTSNEESTDGNQIKTGEAIPMLDDNLLSKMKMFKIMRDSADEK